MRMHLAKLAAALALAGALPAAAMALGSLRLRPSQASNIWPDMIMA